MGVNRASGDRKYDHGPKTQGHGSRDGFIISF
jgi:hypothetical protein